MTYPVNLISHHLSKVTGLLPYYIGFCLKNNAKLISNYVAYAATKSWLLKVCQYQLSLCKQHACKHVFIPLCSFPLSPPTVAFYLSVLASWSILWEGFSSPCHQCYCTLLVCGFPAETLAAYWLEVTHFNEAHLLPIAHVCKLRHITVSVAKGMTIYLSEFLSLSVSTVKFTSMKSYHWLYKSAIFYLCSSGNHKRHTQKSMHIVLNAVSCFCVFLCVFGMDAKAG